MNEMKNINSGKIFIVEDEPFFANLINYDLESKNYTDIKVFFNGEDCVKALKENPRVVILDHQLPGISGMEVLKKIKAHNPDIHVIFLTSQTGPEVAIAAFKQGAHDFIIKTETAFDEVRELLKSIFEKDKAEIKIKDYPGKAKK